MVHGFQTVALMRAATFLTMCVPVCVPPNSRGEDRSEIMGQSTVKA